MSVREGDASLVDAVLEEVRELRLDGAAARVARRTADAEAVVHPGDDEATARK